jgi:hypothetical protein
MKLGSCVSGVFKNIAGTSKRSCVAAICFDYVKSPGDDTGSGLPRRMLGQGQGYHDFPMAALGRNEIWNAEK